MIDEELLSKIYKKDEVPLKEILDKMPVPKLPIITQRDVENKYIIRYFVRLVNDKDYVVEVDKGQYEEFSENPRFITTQIKWKIIGKKETLKLISGINIHGVEDQNKILVADADLTFGGLRRYITNYLGYWIAEN
jgi:hypothetical protein